MQSRLGVVSFLVVIISCLYVGWVLSESKGDPLEFVIYDGHYSYQIAYRIFGEEDLLPQDYGPRDELPSPYRFQRILYPLLARLLAVNTPALIPWTLILINIIAIGLGTLATEFIMQTYKVSVWYALSYGLFGGLFVSLRSDMIA